MFRIGLAPRAAGLVGRPLTTALIVTLMMVTLQPAQGAPVGLGEASNYALLGLNVGSTGTHINLSNVFVTGTAGVSDNSDLVNMAPSTVTGTVFFHDAGSVSGPGHFNGTPATVQQSMNQAVADAFAAN